MTCAAPELPEPVVPPPPSDGEMMARNLERWNEAIARQGDAPEAIAAAGLIDSEFRPVLRACFGNSPFLSDCLLKHPGFAQMCFKNGYEAAIRSVLEQADQDLSDTFSMSTVERILRVSRRQIALGIALADITGSWSLEQVTRSLSNFADWATGKALDALVREAAERGTLALDSAGPAPAASSGLFAIGKGKLGARELNYSSDIDLVVLYDPEAVPIGRPERLQREMVKLTQGLVDLLQKRTADGYVFRTDLRLRPDPASTPVAMSVDAAEVYYESMGQNWERAAMIKARTVAGDKAVGDAFLKMLRPFIWRRNLDFAAIRDVHSIKRQINAHRGGSEIATRGHNVKLGRGGIREIEFFAQTQQLIFGGRDDRLRHRRTIDAINALVEAGRVTPEAADDLTRAYDFLRSVEHRLQMVEDRQTHILPEEPEMFDRFAMFMGYCDTNDFAAVLTHHLKTVERHYAGLFEEAPSLGGSGNLVFTGGAHDPETLETLSSLGFQEPETISSAIRAWHHGRYPAIRSARARELLTELTPALLQAIGSTVAPDDTFRRFDVFIRSLPAGVQLFSLLHANPGLLDLIAEIMGCAPELAETLGRRPVLFDGLLDQGFFDALPSKQAMEADLAEEFSADCDYEEALDTMRRWCADARFRIGVQLLRGTTTAKMAGEAYANVADTIIGAMLPRVEEAFAERHGRFEEGAFCVLALSKHGGQELTATSNLDLVFVYDDRIGDAPSDGQKPLAISRYYARFAQRLLSALTAPTAEGVPFEVDMNLRPSGNKGPLASSYSAFADYQENQAWTWEHMALTRARIVAGPEPLAEDVMAVATKAVNPTHEQSALAADVAQIRQRLAENRPAPGGWHIENMPGGLLDIEFTAQFLILSHAEAANGLHVPRTTGALEALAQAGHLAPEDAEILTEAASLWQTILSILRLTGASLDSEERPPASLESILLRATKRPAMRVLEFDMQELAKKVRGIYDRLVEASAAARVGQCG